MGRRRQHAPLGVYLNNRLLGHLLKEPGGATNFRYDENWLAWGSAIPVSLSLPLREDAYRGPPVTAVFENLLPDSEMLRRQIAERMGAEGSDAYSLLTTIGRDCVGALQFIPEGEELAADRGAIEGDPLDDGEIEKLLTGLARAPLGLARDDDFRISLAGAQEKTALLYDGGKWLKPHRTTPTTHIFKPAIGKLPNGIDLSDSVENEYYCLKLFSAFGLPTNDASIEIFGKTKALVVTRFDRRWTKDGRLLRLPQEDCCQALSIPPSRKYQGEGGPGLVGILDLLKASDTPEQDRKIILMAQVLFWLIGASDGHAKNFSIFLRPGGSFSLTPLYDILTLQPSYDAHQMDRKQMRLAMSVGDNNHYRIDGIRSRHFFQTGKAAGLSKSAVAAAIDEIVDTTGRAMTTLAEGLPPNFPENIHASVSRAMSERLRLLTAED
ncbi:MAG: type II toxin-antitoxin system HipA family toxin [Pseudomonadota bacterium]